MFVRFFLGFMLVATSVFLILLVLIQRGRGGGLAGALGGMGGQSAFGTKAGDLFTKITIGVATFWILLCILSINVLGTQQSLFSTNLGAAAPESMEGLGTTEAIPSDLVPESGSDSSQPPAETSESETSESEMAKTSDDTSSSEPAEPTNESQPDASTDPSPPAEKSAE
ncbi:MAG TPA: preprotein translocase subunit SecG [Planctomycetaceae bacterium]|jgi:preprotein translocase subunit SecG|nr:preprotein translocase subunit SecG [Planctomycetaceae bacterium]|tara:strand:+ start:629 stop:1135 length:507 start_codon:yes stop_codon:yes gene_type:complete